MTRRLIALGTLAPTKARLVVPDNKGGWDAHLASGHWADYRKTMPGLLRGSVFRSAGQRRLR